jgi:hypothetical protein
MRCNSLCLLVVLIQACSLAGCEFFQPGSDQQEPPEEAEPHSDHLPEPLPAPLPEVIAEPLDEEILIEEEEAVAPKKVAKKVAKKAVTVEKKKQPAVLAGMRRANLSPQPVKSQVLGSEKIKSIISARIPQVRACYERELKTDSTLEGKVTAGWTIRPDGSVASVRIKKNTTGNQSLAPCIKKSVARWRFPASRSSSDVEYPFVFKTKEKWQWTKEKWQ